MGLVTSPTPFDARNTFCKWRSKYGGATVADVKRLRELETENGKLKRMYADLALESNPPQVHPACTRTKTR
jgi:putative transposase